MSCPERHGGQRRIRRDRRELRCAFVPDVCLWSSCRGLAEAGPIHPPGPKLTSDSSQTGRLIVEIIGPLRFPTGRTLGRFRPPLLLSLDCLLHAPPTDSVRAVDSRPVHGWPVSGLFHPAHQVVASSKVRAVRHRRVVVLLEPFVWSQSLRALVARTKVVIEAGERHKASLEEGLGFLNRLDVREASRRRPNVVEPQEYLVQLSDALISSRDFNVQGISHCVSS